ncbi:MAG TPA: hypothetical protein VF271_03000 [Rhodanobacteraceae bacterium]|nr:hypothetical protein [Oleiagrimonas sp.]
MNAVTPLPAHRVRTRTEIDRDVLAACRRLGELAMKAELAMQPPDRDAIGPVAEGLRRLLIEGRAQG